MTIKTLLDDAAAHATVDRQVDLGLVLERAEGQRRRRRAIRRRSGLAFLAVAAVIALIAVLLPVGALVKGKGTPADEPSPLPAVTGVPATWYYAPVWTPPVTRHPMTAAVMVLSAPLRNTSSEYDYRGPILVSADARTYATLPDWGPHDGGVTLSPDGQQVAWWTAPPREGGKAPTIHRLVLATGKQNDYEMPPFTPQSMVWAENDVVVSGPDWYGSYKDKKGRLPITNRIHLDGSNQDICDCASRLLSLDLAGRNVLNAKEVAQIPIVPDVAAAALTPAPDREHWAVANPGGTVGQWIVSQIPTSGRYDPLAGDRVITSDEPVESAKVLAWTDAGIFVQVNTRQGAGQPVHRSIRVMDPRTGSSKVIARPHDTTVMIPVALAAGLVATAEPIPGPPVSFDTRDPAHLAFLASVAWGLYSFWIVLGAGALIAGIAALVVWRVRGRRGTS